MKREPQDIKHLVRQYEQKMSEASIPLWLEVPDILSVLDYYEQQGLYFESEQCMRIALQLHPNNAEVLVRKAYRLKNEGRWQEAIEWVRNAPLQNSLELLFFEAEYALSLLQFEKAEELFLTGVRLEYPELGRQIDSSEEAAADINDLYLEMSELFMDYGAPQQAQKYLEKISKETSEYVRAQTLWAECELQLGQGEAALSRLNQVLDEDPYYLDAWILLADISTQMQNYEKCREASQFALAIDPKNEKALRFKAVAALSLNAYDEVLEIYEAYRLLFPTDYTLALSAGEILLQKNRWQEAREVLIRSNQACPNENPDKQRILTDIARSYIAERNFAQAYETLLGCTSLGMSYADVSFTMAHLCLVPNILPESLHYLERYLQIEPLSSDTRLRLASMLAEANAFQEVFPIWKRLFEISERGPVLAAPYLAFAARRLLLINEYFLWLAYSCHEDPTLTKKIFQTIYPNAAPTEYLTYAHLEFPS